MFSSREGEEWRGENEDPREWMIELLTWAVNEGKPDERVLSARKAPQLGQFVGLPIESIAKITLTGANEWGKEVPEEKIPRDTEELTKILKDTMEILVKAVVLRIAEEIKIKGLGAVLEGGEVETKFLERQQETVETAIDELLQEVEELAAEESET